MIDIALLLQIIDMVAHSSEFENIVVREEEQNELEMLARTSCPLEIKGGPSNKQGKVSILIQVIMNQFPDMKVTLVYYINLVVNNFMLILPHSCTFLGVLSIPFH